MLFIKKSWGGGDVLYVLGKIGASVSQGKEHSCRAEEESGVEVNLDCAGVGTLVGGVQC